MGEVWFSGSGVAEGYWNQPEETEHTFHAYLADTGEGPFLRTGDLGFLHEGEILFVGRLKELIIIRGRNLSPERIELTVEQSHPALRPASAVAFSIDVDDEERRPRDERPKTYPAAFSPLQLVNQLVWSRMIFHPRAVRWNSSVKIPPAAPPAALSRSKCHRPITDA